MIPFAFIPQGLREPFFFAEVNASRANTAANAKRALIIGQITGAGVAAANLPVISAGLADGAAKGGPGSHLDLMTRAYRANDPFGELWYLPLADAGGAVAAAGTLTFTGPSTSAGVLSLYVAGALVSVAVASGAAAAAVATAVAAAINAAPNLPVTALAAAAVVTATARNAGLVGNDIDLRLNYLGIAGGQAIPAGLACAIVAMSGGATNPTLTTALANLLDQPFDFIISPYTDPTSMAAIAALLNDATGRWSWTAQVYGHQFTAYRGTFGASTTFGLTLNDQHATCMAVYDSPSMACQWAAAIGAADAVSARADAAQPAREMALGGILAPPLASRFSPAQRETLLYDGLSTYRVDQGGNVIIDKLITTCQLNSFGQPDNSYLNIETMTTLTEVLRRLMGLVTSKYARMKLAADGTPFAPGSNIVTPAIARGDLIANYLEMEYDGLVQQGAIFAANLVVQQNSQNPNRLDVLWPAILINQLDIFALLAQFRLS